MVIPIVAQEIRRLSQEDGLFDEEIAERLGLSRATVNRARQQYEIPKANLDNREDRTFYCPACKETMTVRRGYPYSICPKCHS